MTGVLSEYYSDLDYIKILVSKSLTTGATFAGISYIVNKLDYNDGNSIKQLMYDVISQGLSTASSTVLIEFIYKWLGGDYGKLQTAVAEAGLSSYVNLYAYKYFVENNQDLQDTSKFYSSSSLVMYSLLSEFVSYVITRGFWVEALGVRNTAPCSRLI